MSSQVFADVWALVFMSSAPWSTGAAEWHGEWLDSLARYAPSADPAASRTPAVP